MSVEASTTPGVQWDSWIADVTLVSSTGSVFPMFNGQSFGGSAWSGGAGTQFDIAKDSDPAIATHYYLADQVGTTQMALSSGGWQGWFTPFGQEIVNGAEQNAIGQTPPDGTTYRFKFTGKERDTESGLDYFGARYYASSMGRFMSPDWSASPEAVPYSHLENPQSLNLYGYVLNNPLSKPDLDGHGCPPDCGDPTLPTAVAPQPHGWLDRFLDGGARAFQHPAFQAFLMFVPGVGPEAGGIEEGAAADAASGSTIQANAAQGKAFQDAVAAETAQTNTNVVQNVTLKTQSGVKTVVDVVSKDPSGNTALQEAKSSPTAPLTKNQAAAHPEIANTGATVAGKGKPGFPGGTKIPPTNVQIVRPKPPQQQ